MQDKDNSNLRPGDVVSFIKMRENGSAHLKRWGEVWMDFAVVETSHNTFNINTRPLQRVHDMELKKYKKYKEVQFSSSATFFPTVASTSGAWGHEAQKAFSLVAEHIADANLTTTNHELAKLRRFMSTMVMKRIASDILTVQLELNNNRRRVNNEQHN